MYRHCVTDPPPALISPLVTATMEHAHGHGSAPDHHDPWWWRRSGARSCKSRQTPTSSQSQIWAILVGFYVHLVLKDRPTTNREAARARCDSSRRGRRRFIAPYSPAPRCAPSATVAIARLRVSSPLAPASTRACPGTAERGPRLAEVSQLLPTRRTRGAETRGRNPGALLI